MCVYICVCMCVHTYVCLRVCTHVCVYMCAHMHGGQRTTSRRQLSLFPHRVELRSLGLETRVLTSRAVLSTLKIHFEIVSYANPVSRRDFLKNFYLGQTTGENIPCIKPIVGMWNLGRWRVSKSQERRDECSGF